MSRGKRSAWEKVDGTYGLCGGKPLALVLLKTSDNLWYSSGMVIMLGVSGVLKLVDATGEHDSCRHWLIQDLVTSLL